MSNVRCDDLTRNDERCDDLTRNDERCGDLTWRVMNSP